MAATTAPGLLAPGDDVVAVLDRDRELVSALDDRTAEVLRRRVKVPRLWVESGAWAPPHADEVGERSLGLLILGGYVIRSVRLAGRDCPELLGPGDVIRPWEDDAGAASVDHASSWSALERTELALLDETLAAVAVRFPAVMGRVIERSTERSRRLAFTLAIAHVRRAETRVLMVLWHLADRWGKVGPGGVRVPVRLTHELIAHLACMRRPTASTALQRLDRAGEIVRAADGSWILTGSPPHS